MSNFPTKRQIDAVNRKLRRDRANASNLCVLCGQNYGEYGNNPAPLSDHGRCCNSCNNDVIQARINLIFGR